MTEPLPAPWGHSFDVTTRDQLDPRGRIVLDQVGLKTFVLGSTLRYKGLKTGLEDMELGDDVLEDIRSVTPEQLVPDTDLASVPGPLRWFLNSYGTHTPAALIHDRLIPVADLPAPTSERMTDAYADRYFRFMLEDLGEPWIKRWLMWSAVAFRTFLATRRPWAITWVVLAVLGIVLFVVGVALGNLALVLVAVVAPLPAAALWRRQYGAGLVASACAVFIVPAAFFAAVGFATYWLAERGLGRLFPDKSRSVAEPGSQTGLGGRSAA